MDELTLKDFNELTKKQKERAVARACSWFCVFISMNPLLRHANSVEIDTIKIVLGNYEAK